MNRIIGFGAGCALMAGLMALAAPPAAAQTTPEVTVTYKLTLYGTVPANDGFVASFGQNGVQMCKPCVGGGHVYVVTSPWPRSDQPVHYVFLRFNVPPFSGGSVTAHPLDSFGQQT